MIEWVSLIERERIAYLKEIARHDSAFAEGRRYACQKTCDSLEKSYVLHK